MTFAIPRPIRPAIQPQLPVDERPTRRVWILRVVLYCGLALALAIGSPVIRAAAAFAFPLALLADRDGAIRHLARSCGLVLALLLAPNLGSCAANAMLSFSGMSPLLAQALGAVIAVLGTVLVCGLAGGWVQRRAERRPALRDANRICGAMLGTAEGALLMACACWLMGAFEKPVQSLGAKLDEVNGNPMQREVVHFAGSMSTAARNDPVGGWLMERNPLLALPAVQSAQLVAEVAANPQRVLNAAQSGKLDALAEIPEVQHYLDAVRNDPTVADAYQHHDLSAILGSRHVQAMLADRSLHQALLSHRDELLQATADPAFDAAPKGPDHFQIVSPQELPRFADQHKVTAHKPTQRRTNTRQPRH